MPAESPNRAKRESAIKICKRFLYPCADHDDLPAGPVSLDEFGQKNGLLLDWCGLNAQQHVAPLRQVWALFLQFPELAIALSKGTLIPESAALAIREADDAYNRIDRMNEGKQGKRKGGISKVATALTLLCQHPDWSNKKIASEAGCNPKYLSQCDQFKNARKITKAIGKESMIKAKKSRGSDMDEYGADES